MQSYDLDYEIEQTPADFGWIHEDECPDVEHCKDMVKGLIEAVYKTGNITNLEDCIDELAHQFGVDMPKKEPVLNQQASVRTDRALNSWLQLNQSYNECLRKQATR